MALGICGYLYVVLTLRAEPLGMKQPGELKKQGVGAELGTDGVSHNRE